MDHNDPYYVFTSLMSRFAYTDSRESDSSVTHALLDNAADPNASYALSDLARQASVSEATVSRYVRKLYFRDYRDFRAKVPACYYAARQKRLTRFSQTPAEYAEELYVQQRQDLDRLHADLDLNLLTDCIRRIREKKNLILIGSPSLTGALDSFRQDLLAGGTACYLYYPTRTQYDCLCRADHDSVLLYVIADNPALDPYADQIRRLHQAGAGQYLLTCAGESPLAECFDSILNVACGSPLGPGNLYRCLGEILSAILAAEIRQEESGR